MCASVVTNSNTKGLADFEVYFLLVAKLFGAPECDAVNKHSQYKKSVKW